MAYLLKEDQAACAKRHYEKNKVVMKERAKSFKAKKLEENEKFLLDYLTEHPCVDCGESDLVVLDFDHVRGIKKFNIASSRGSHCLETLKEEVAKCEIRCANCHRRKTAKQFGWARKKLLRIGDTGVTAAS